MQITRIEMLRAELESAIEKAIELLDELDGDPDLEPSLGYQLYVHTWGRRDAIDLELDDFPSMIDHQNRCRPRQRCRGR